MKKLLILVVVLFFSGCASISTKPCITDIGVSNTMMVVNNEYLSGDMSIETYEQNVDLFQCYLFIVKYSPEYSMLTERLLSELKTLDETIKDRKSRKISEQDFKIQLEASNNNIIAFVADIAVKMQLSK